MWFWLKLVVGIAVVGDVGASSITLQQVSAQFFLLIVSAKSTSNMKIWVTLSFTLT